MFQIVFKIGEGTALGIHFITNFITIVQYLFQRVRADVNLMV